MKFFLLDKQQNIIGRLSEEYILEATFTEEINTAGELLITLPAKKRLSGNVIHVLITNPSKDHSYLMFKIIKETVKDEEVEYTAVESAYDELTSYGYIQDKRPTANAQTITEMILKDTRWHVGEIPDTSEAFISFYYLSVLDCLKKIVQTFDFEIGFDVLINDDENQITDRRVNFYIKQGEQTGKRFEYGSNLLSIKQEQDTQNIYTAIVGRGKGVQVSGGDDDNTPDGYGRRITFADVEWSKANGDPLDKPKGQEWLEDPDATKQLGFSDGHMRIGLEVFEDVDDPKVLLQKTYEALKTAERPQVQFSASVINTGELHLGDRVGITRNDIGIAYETRVFKVQHNLLDETQNKIDLGDNLEQTNNLSYQVSALQSEVTNNTEGIITVTQSANGKNKVYYSSTMPATGSNGDVWYKDLGNGETEMYIYDNGWQLVISTENLHKIEDEIKQQQTALDQAVQDANAASAKADGLVAQVGDANTNAQKALTTAQQNQADLTQAKNQLSNIQSDLTSEKSTLSSAISDISQTKQRLSDLTTQAQTQGQTIANIQKTQSGLTADIADVKGNVSSLQDTANGLQAAVADNKNNISSLKQTAQGLESTVSNMRVGGTNLLRNTKMMNGSYWFSQQSPIQSYYQGIGVIHVASDWRNVRYNYPSLVADGIPNNTNDVFTFSCLVKKSDKNSNGSISFFCGAVNVLSTHIDQSAINADYWTQIWVTFKFKPSSEINASDDYRNSMRFEQGGSVGTMLYTMFKLEKGSVPTAYSPAPQDTDDSISSISQKADSIKSTVQTNSGNISSLQQTAKSLQSTITNNSNDISSLKQTADGLQATVSNIDVNNKNLFSVKKATVQNGIVTSDFIPIIPGKDYILTIYNKGNGTDTFGNYYEADKTTKGSVSELPGDGNTNMANGSVVVHVPQNNALKYIQILIGLWNFGNITADQLKVSFTLGNSPVEYQPSYFDEVTDTANMKLDITGLTTDVANSKGDISSLKQRADSMESNISDNKNDISDLKQTASSLQSNIQSKTDISQFTQLSNAFQTVVQNIGPFYPDGDFSDTDLSKYYDPWDTCTSLDNFSVVTNNKDWGYYLQIYTPHGTINKAITKEYLPINAQYSLTFKGKSLLSYGGKLNGSFMVYMHFFDSNKNAIQNQASYYKYDNNNVWQDFSLSFTPPSNAAYVRVETVLDNSKGDGVYWGALDNLSIENGEATIASKISQMSDDINLRVQKGDLLSQINIQAGSTLIQSKKLFLDASSVVFSGNAFIPSAAITDLSADKITAGTLNAGNVNIINLDVNKLVGNTTEFVRSGWTNAYGSHVQIDGGGMSITYGDWLTKFEPDGMVFRDGNEDIGGFTRIGMQNAPSWYSGLAFNAGGDAEFLSIGAQDYHNDSQNPVPAKLLWMRKDINTYGYHSGWNFCDDVWAGQVGMSSIQYGDWNIHFEKITGNDGFSALTLVSGSGDGFYWGSDGSFGYVTNHGGLHNVRGSQIVYDINQNGGTCQSWSGVD